MMKAKHILKSTIVILVVLLLFSGCESPDEVIDELQLSREFAPVGLTAFVRSQSNIELNWNEDVNVSTYLVEVSENENFSTITESLNVNYDELPIEISLIGETLYYIRVKAISSRGLEDSTYAIISEETLEEQLFLQPQAGDILANEATLRWTPNSAVTQITLSPGDIVRDITNDELVSGVAVISGLTGNTEYSAQLLYNSNVRGSLSFTTEFDVNDGTLLTPDDDIFQAVADANPDDILILSNGDYSAQTGTIVIDKPLTIRGSLSFDKPALTVSFSLITGATDVSLINLDLTGGGVGADLKDMLRYSASGNYNSLLVSGCNVHDYERSFIAGNETDALIQSITVENSIVSDIFTISGDFFDFRNSDVFNVNFNTSTFSNCAPDRDFLRIDDAGTSTQNGLTCNVTIDSCTMYACANNSSRRLLYVRFQDNNIVVSNTLITDTEAEGYSDQTRTDEFIDFSNNNYFNAPTFYDSSVLRYDNSSSYTTLDPGYVDAANGDFTLTTQSLIDYQIGDPRWR